MRADILLRMDEVIEEIAAENETMMPEAKAHHGGELQLPRTIRHVVIEDLVRRLG